MRVLALIISNQCSKGNVDVLVPVTVVVVVVVVVVVKEETY